MTLKSEARECSICLFCGVRRHIELGNALFTDRARSDSNAFLFTEAGSARADLVDVCARLHRPPLRCYPLLVPPDDASSLSGKVRDL